VPAQAPFEQAWFVHAAPSCQLPVPSQVCTTDPLHCFAPAVHVPEHAPPLQSVGHGVPSFHLPVASQVCGVKPSHVRVVGAQSPVQTPAVQRSGQVSRRVVVTRSIPHSSRSASEQKTSFGILPAHPPTIGWQEPAFAPGVVSQLLLPAQVPFGTHLPFAQMSCPFCACPAHAYAPFGEHDVPRVPTAVPSPTGPIPAAPSGSAPSKPPSRSPGDPPPFPFLPPLEETSAPAPEVFDMPPLDDVAPPELSPPAVPFEPPPPPSRPAPPSTRG
jgi:hypothetical protein